MIKVLHILDSLDMGGVETFVINLYRFIDKTKIQFDFIIFKQENYYEDEVYRYGGRVYKAVGLEYIDQMKYINKVIKNNDYHIIHCHNCALKGLIREIVPAKFAKKNSVVIAHSHNTGTPSNTYIDRFTRLLLKGIITGLSDYLFACSYIAAESKFLMNTKKQIHIIRNGIDVKKFVFKDNVRKKIRDELHVHENEILFGTVGRLEEQKNQKFLIESFRKMIEKNQNCKLLIIGEGKKREELEKLVLKYNLNNKIYFLGNVNNVNEYMAAMDCFVFPSLYEGLGIVLIEAQSSGIPCMVSECIPDEAIISNLVKKIPLIENEWVNAMLTWKENKKRYYCYKNAIKNNYDMKMIAKNMEFFYESNFNRKK